MSSKSAQPITEAVQDVVDSTSLSGCAGARVGRWKSRTGNMMTNRYHQKSLMQ